MINYYHIAHSLQQNVTDSWHFHPQISQNSHVTNSLSSENGDRLGVKNYAASKAIWCLNGRMWQFNIKTAIIVNVLYTVKHYFCCILIFQFWNLEILQHFNFAFSRFPRALQVFYQANWIFSRVFNFTILSSSRNSRKFHARKNNIVYSSLCSNCGSLCSFSCWLLTIPQTLPPL